MKSDIHAGNITDLFNGKTSDNTCVEDDKNTVSLLNYHKITSTGVDVSTFLVFSDFQKNTFSNFKTQVFQL